MTSNFNNQETTCVPFIGNILKVLIYSAEIELFSDSCLFVHITIDIIIGYKIKQIFFFCLHSVEYHNNNHTDSKD